MLFWILAISILALAGYAASKINGQPDDRYVPVRVRINRNR